MYFNELKNINELSDVIVQDISNIVNNRNKFYLYHNNFIVDFANRIKGKEVVIVGSGPTAADYKPLDGVIHIAVNRSIERTDINFDLWFFADFRAMTFHYKYSAEKINKTIESRKVNLIISKRPVDIISSVPDSFLDEINHFHL